MTHIIQNQFGWWAIGKNEDSAKMVAYSTIVLLHYVNQANLGDIPIT